MTEQPARLTLRHPSGATPVLVGEDALASALPELAAWASGRTVFVVTTPRVLGLHGRCLDPLAEAASRWLMLVV